MPARIITIQPEQAGQRLDNFLVTQLKGVPKSKIYNIIRSGEVRVNSGRIKHLYRLVSGDAIRIPPIRVSRGDACVAHDQRTLDTLTSRILYEDKGLLILNKPSGMAVHGGSGISLGVIENLRALFPREKSLELVHRLDRETSGCLVVSKKPSILKQLHTLLREAQGVEKTYVALVQGDWPKKLTRIDEPLHKNQLSSGERIVRVHSEGKPSLTLFKVLERFGWATLVEATPKTGRTHQIRVHALHAGHPLAGDEKYGNKVFNKEMRQHGCKRLFLHAAKIAFTLPDTEQYIAVSAPLDSDLDIFLEHIRAAD
ncbi:MAG: 23S rRNA pseudouridine(955/2504/2580) synthase RluC [Gammaproteobacteria bacterium]